MDKKQAQAFSTVLVTGGAGFIGSNFIHYFLREHPESNLINYDNLTYAGNLASLADVEKNPRYTFIKGDIADAKAVDEALSRGVDAVINFAAESHVDRSIEHAGEFVRTNVLGTQTLLEAARRHGVRRFFQISTDEVYGSLGEKGYFTEETNLAPNSPYSATKAGADLLVRAYHHTFGMDVVITRCSNNYGPFQFPEKLIPLMITTALENQPLPVYGDGMNVRDWIHVDDHCRAIDLVLHRGKAGEVYNVGGHNERSNLDVVKTILRLLDRPETLIRFVADRPGHDRRYAIDSSKLERELGWAPTVNFEEGLCQTVQWYLEHREWWGLIRTGAYKDYYEKMYERRLEQGKGL